MLDGIDMAECARRGAIGAFGSIPGTLVAHPCDVIKMRQQVSGLPLASTIAGISSVGSLYGGVGAGVAQKIATRGPMFLASEFSTQTVQKGFGLERDRAVFVGSSMSGYVTGFLAAGFEWSKVQGGVGGAVAAASKQLAAPLSRRLTVRHGAGLRNGIFDATFFGCEHTARNHWGWTPALSYGAAAALAVTLDFPLDAAVKQSMAAPAHTIAEPGGPLGATWRLLRLRGLGVFAGLTAKACEFAVSYAVTGACSTHVTRVLQGMF